MPVDPTENGSGVNLSSLLASGKYSDLTLVCEDREFAVHKNILCAQSRVIRAECEGDFQVRVVTPSARTLTCINIPGTQESKLNFINIEEFDADTVQRMVEVLYSGDYSVSQHTNSSHDDAQKVEEARSEGKSAAIFICIVWNGFLL